MEHFREVHLETSNTPELIGLAREVEKCGESGEHVIVRLPGGRLALMTPVAPDENPQLKAETAAALCDHLFVESIRRSLAEYQSAERGSSLPPGVRPGDERIPLADGSFLGSLERGLTQFTAGTGTCMPRGERPH